MRGTIWVVLQLFWILISACASPAATLPATLPVTSPTLTTTPSATRPVPTPSPRSTQTPAAPQITPSASPTPDAIPSATACTTPSGRYEMYSLEVPELGYPLSLNIYLPPCYEMDTSQRYPVLYLFHGFRYSNDQWQRLGVGETIETLLTEGSIPPFLVVMPLDREVTEPDENPLDHIFVDEIIPWVDQNFRTLPDRDYRAVGGLSRGAGWAVHFGLTQWEYFSAVGAHSLALFWYDSRRNSEWLDEIPSDRLPRFYLDIGSSDAQLEEPLYAFLAALDRRNIPHEWHLFRGFHDENYWRGHLEYYIRWYAAAWSDLIP